MGSVRGCRSRGSVRVMIKRIKCFLVGILSLMTSLSLGRFRGVPKVPQSFGEFISSSNTFAFSITDTTK